jgi:NADH-quinone oxidoreductase subunit H
MLAGLIGVVALVAVNALFLIWMERKVSAHMQLRPGPMEVGWHGAIQTVADALKLMGKELITPRDVDRWVYLMAPVVIFLPVLLSFLVIPFSQTLIIRDMNVGILLILAFAALSVLAILMAGWASNNKYSLFGAMRSAAQIVSYEIPAVMILLVPVMIVGSLSLRDITEAQYGGLQNWFLFRYFPIMPVAFLVFFVAGLAETNRAPFDIPEAESELVAGFHTEYSGFFFAMFFMAEYTEMFVFSSVATVLFLGGYQSPFPNGWLQTAGPVPMGWFWLWLKAWSLVFVMMWLRWTLPRSRVDQLMHIAWKVLLPIALALVVVVGFFVLLPATENGFWWDPWVGWPLTTLLFGFLLYVMVRALQWNKRRARELAA